MDLERVRKYYTLSNQLVLFLSYSQTNGLKTRLASNPQPAEPSKATIVEPYQKMQIIKIDLNKNYDDVIVEACRLLRLGEVIVYPTDTVYGLGANACDSFAVDRVFKIKKRARSKPLPVIARNLSWVEALAYLSPKTKKVVSSFWPGAVTAVLPSKEHISSLARAGGSSVGLRIPDFVFIDKLLGKFGYPLTATSANISGEDATNDPNKIIERFSQSAYRPSLVIDAGILPKSKPSTVVDFTSDLPKILRVGPSRPEQLLKLLDFKID